jgi:hypothetical protein
VTHRARRQSPYESLIARPQLIEEARRHQRRRRKLAGTALVTPVALGCLIVGLVFVDAGQGKVVAPSATSPLRGHASPAPPKKSPSTLSPSNVVVLNPATGDVVVASPSQRAAAALQAAQIAAAQHAQIAAATQAVNSRSNPTRAVVPGQEASQAANAEVQAAAAAAAATQSTNR